MTTVPSICMLYISCRCSVLNYSCSKAHSPAPQKARQTNNKSIFDACHWIVCGRGSCNKTSTFFYTSECDVGYYNLLNSTAFPCYKQCAPGMDCTNLETINEKLIIF